jgi:hypothetical protein
MSWRRTVRFVAVLPLCEAGEHTGLAAHFTFDALSLEDAQRRLELSVSDRGWLMKYIFADDEGRDRESYVDAVLNAGPLAWYLFPLADIVEQIPLPTPFVRPIGDA